MYELVAPAARYRDSFLAAVAENGEGILTGRWCTRGDRLASPGVLEELLAQLNAEEHDPPPGWVPALHRWIVDGPNYLGRITLRAGLTPPLEQAIGQIGYAVRPSARGRGVATWALGAMLGIAAGRGMDRVPIHLRRRQCHLRRRHRAPRRSPGGPPSAARRAAAPPLLDRPAPERLNTKTA